MKFRSRFAIVFACASVFMTSAHADPFPLVAGNCDRELPGLLDVEKGGSLELTPTPTKDGAIVLDLKRNWASGKSETYRLKTSQSELLGYMKAEREALKKEGKAIPTPDGAVILFPERSDWLRDGMVLVSGKRLEKDSGFMGIGATYYPIPLVSRGDALTKVTAEIMNDACAYETKLAADQRAVKELVGRIGDFGRKAWSKISPNPKVATQVQRKADEKASSIGEVKKSGSDAPMRRTHAKSTISGSLGDARPLYQP